MTAKNYFNNLDFFKTIFTITVLWYHLRLFTQAPKIAHAWDGNYIVVDFFFIVSGFLLFFNQTAEKIGTFLKKRYFRLAPIVIFQIIFIDFIYPGTNSTDVFLGTFFLNSIVHQNFYFTWFVPVLFWGNIFYFCFRKHIHQKYSLPIISLVVYLCYCFVLNSNNHSLDVHTRNVSIIFNLGFLRGIAGIGLGYLLSIYTSKREQNHNLLKTIVYSGIELLLLFFLFNKIFMYKKISHLTDINMLFVFSGLVYFFTLNYGIVSKLLNKIPWHKIAKFNFSIYVMQFISIKLSEKLFQYLSLKYKILSGTHDLFWFTFIFCLLLGILIYYILEKPVYVFLSKKFIKKDFSQTSLLDYK